MPGLYLHIPYCDHKCLYCDFYSIESLGTMDLFLDSLKTEIGLYANGKGAGRPVRGSAAREQTEAQGERGERPVPRSPRVWMVVVECHRCPPSY